MNPAVQALAERAIREHWDFLPTACELAGVKVPAEVDGLSFVNTLRGKRQESHKYLYWQYGKKQAVRAGNWKAVQLDRTKPVELYDLDEDLGEQKDVAKENAEVVEQLTRFMAQAVK